LSYYYLVFNRNIFFIKCLIKEIDYDGIKLPQLENSKLAV
jgi:hypothetical protein